MKYTDCSKFQPLTYLLKEGVHAGKFTEVLVPSINADSNPIQTTFKQDTDMLTIYDSNWQQNGPISRYDSSTQVKVQGDNVLTLTFHALRNISPLT